MGKIKKNKNKLILLVILIVIVGAYFKIVQFNIVRAGGQVRSLHIEKFWCHDRYYLILENDDGKIREYIISEKDYYRLKLNQYIIIFMDNHIETLDEYKNRLSIDLILPINLKSTIKDFSKQQIFVSIISNNNLNKPN